MSLSTLNMFAQRARAPSSLPPKMEISLEQKTRGSYFSHSLLLLAIFSFGEPLLFHFLFQLFEINGSAASAAFGASTRAWFKAPV